MSPEPSRPRRQLPLTTRPYLNQPCNTDDYVYQQTLRPNQRPIPWRLIPIQIPESTKKNIPCNPKDPRLSQDQEPDVNLQDQELEDMNKQLLAELEVPSSSSESSIDSPKQDLDLQDHPEDWLVLDEL